MILVNNIFYYSNLLKAVNLALSIPFPDSDFPAVEDKTLLSAFQFPLSVLPLSAGIAYILTQRATHFHASLSSEQYHHLCLRTIQSLS